MFRRSGERVACTARKGEISSGAESAMTVHVLEVFADYFQFYVWDAGVSPLAPEDYTDEDVRRRVKVAPNVVVVLPVRNMTVPVEVELHAGDPGFDETG